MSRAQTLGGLRLPPRDPPARSRGQSPLGLQFSWRGAAIMETQSWRGVDQGDAGVSCVGARPCGRVSVTSGSRAHDRLPGMVADTTVSVREPGRWWKHSPISEGTEAGCRMCWPWRGGEEATGATVPCPRWPQGNSLGFCREKLKRAVCVAGGAGGATVSPWAVSRGHGGAHSWPLCPAWGVGLRSAAPWHHPHSLSLPSSASVPGTPPAVHHSLPVSPDPLLIQFK